MSITNLKYHVMQKLLAILAISAILAACNDNTNPDEKTTDTIPVAPAPVNPVDTTVIDTTGHH